MIEVRNVCHTYNKNANQEILHNISLIIPDGKFCILLGQSGSGKTTLLNIVGGLMKPSKGEILWNGESVYGRTNDQLCKFRHDNIGFVFQNFFLEKCFSAEENVLIPLFLDKGFNLTEKKEKVDSVLNMVGLEHKKMRKPTELSGGECQRISIARALVTEPDLIIADEPTGNLDSVNGEKIIELLKKQVEKGKTVLMVTHNESYTKYADIVFNMLDGAIK